MKKHFHGGGKHALNTFFEQRGILIPGPHVKPDPRLTGRYWAPARFDEDGFFTAYGVMLLTEDYIWQMRAPERSLIFMVVMKGTVECRPVDQPLVTLGEDMFHLSFWKAGEPHLIRAFRGYCEMAVFEMNRRFVERYLDNTPPVRYNDRLVSMPGITGRFEVVDSLNGSMRQPLFHLVHPRVSPEVPERTTLQRLVTLIMEKQAKKEDSRITDLVTYIDNNLHKPLPVRDLCRQMSMGETYLRDQFKRLTGQSVYRYIVNRKMARAMDLITGSNLSVSSIASEVGYENLISFEKIFTKKFGHPPTYFREKGDDETRKG